MTCLKISPAQVQCIVDLAAHHQEKAPEFLDLLNVIVKVEGLGLTLKRNQAYVMKYIMQVSAFFLECKNRRIGSFGFDSHGYCSLALHSQFETWSGINPNIFQFLHNFGLFHLQIIVVFFNKSAFFLFLIKNATILKALLFVSPTL